MSIGCRSFGMVMVVASLIMSAGGPAGAADAVVPLPAADRAQLDKYLGPGVVGDPMYFQTSSDGGAVIAGDEDNDNEVLSRFTPGEPLMIVGLKPGESRQVNVKVQVSDLSKPDKITHKGSLAITYSYIGAYKVKVPAGSFDAVLIKWDYKGSVGPADVEQTDYRFIAPHAGMVAMIQSRHISVMLIYNDKTKLGKLLQSSK